MCYKLWTRGHRHHLFGPVAPAHGFIPLLHYLSVHLLPPSAAAGDDLLLREDPAGAARGVAAGARITDLFSVPPFCGRRRFQIVAPFCDLQVGGASGERRESRVLQMVVCMVAGYLLCWMPYGVVAMLASFGPPGAVPPIASLIPSLLAKTSTVLNPVIYVRLNHQVAMATLLARIKRNHSPLIFFFFLNERLSVLQVLLVHDRLELRGLSHPGQPDGFSLPGGVVTSSQLARPGAQSCSCHVESTAGLLRF